MRYAVRTAAGDGYRIYLEFPGLMVLPAMQSIVRRRAASGAPHHEELRICREIRPRPEELAGRRASRRTAARGIVAE
ncbi:hypothetical protein BRAS3843_990027 [Bradyrhizobium sp. STM 3843]|nr:hypothetical protein BRAS3843_990027 [Bradyrhizobium sp. STM 3843]